MWVDTPGATLASLICALFIRRRLYAQTWVEAKCCLIVQPGTGWNSSIAMIRIPCNLGQRIPQEAGSMNTERIENRCPKCQAPLPANAPRGLCPKCLLVAVSTPTEAGQPADKNPPPPIEAVAAAFPHLEILEIIGQGGMGIVYKARQPHLDRLVALKLLPQSLAADATFAERFNREARVLARLNHPNIVTVHDFGQSGGFFYLLMEFVDGVNLRQAMRAGRFTPQQAMHLVPKICEALQFAHDEGILHRDIKPENILLDTRGRVKIADFGIAKLVGEAKDSFTLTASGMAVGTPHYMAPEQLEHPQDVDQRADIYSLGVVFYEMLTGELPIGRFAPPSQKSPVDPRVDEVVFHALEKEREKRFRSAGEVKTSVEAITTSAVAASARPQPAPTVVLPIRRADCYFSTPERMRNCFPAPQAHIFQCKGELRLETENLVFVSPWQTRFVIPLREISDLSMGQFQMRTTPWVMKYERIFFLSISFGTGGRQRTVHLTPVPANASSSASINAQVSEWFNAVSQATVAITGTSPHVSEPAAVTLRAQQSWVRRTARLWLLAPVSAWLVGAMNPRSPFGPAPLAPWLGAFILMVLVCLKLGWFALGFLRAKRALNAGKLEAVTSDEPPGDAGDAGEAARQPGEPGREKAARPLWWTVTAWAFALVGAMAVIDTLTGLYSRPIHETLYPGVAQLVAGIAMLTLSRRWRMVALVTLALALAAGAFISVMLIIAPERGLVTLPGVTGSVPVTEMPRLAATAVFFLGLFLGAPFYLLMSAKGRALFGLAKPK
jgi:serine/threonine protein kinase